MLSVVASLTPYSDYNQSPRNMYQCQMGKQTMGTPAQALAHRTDTKLYRLQTPQTPIARTARHVGGSQLIRCHTCPPVPALFACF